MNLIRHGRGKDTKVIMNVGNLAQHTFWRIPPLPNGGATGANAREYLRPEPCVCASLLGNWDGLHCFFIIEKQQIIHPAIKHAPPIGVIGPSQPIPEIPSSSFVESK